MYTPVALIDSFDFLSSLYVKEVYTNAYSICDLCLALEEGGT